MNRRNFFRLTGTGTAGLLVVPDFLYSFAMQEHTAPADNFLVFIQLYGGNDGLNTFVPYQDPLYYRHRPAIALSEKEVIASGGGMGFHPALTKFAEMQQNGHLTVIQNVGYPNPDRSHFRSTEIWQTGSATTEYLTEGWLGRYFDHIHAGHHHPTTGINIGKYDNLALKGLEPNTITLKATNATKSGGYAKTKLSGNPQLDFVRKLAASTTQGYKEINTALQNAPATEAPYPPGQLSQNLKWIGNLIKGNLNSKVYYTSLSGFDTHANQLAAHNARLAELNEAVFAFYSDMKVAKRLDNTTIVIFSEFGRRVVTTGSGTDHGTAAPMFIIGGNNKSKIIGKNPDLQNLIDKDLKHEIDFRSVYASLLKDKLSFDPKIIGIKNQALTGLF